MKRKDKEITDRTWIDGIIKNSQVCRIATAVKDMPYVIPVSFGYDGEALYIHTAREGKKIDYFKKNQNVCFEFEGNVKLIKSKDKACNWTFDYESVIGYGKVSQLTKSADKIHGLDTILFHYSGQNWPIEKKDLKRTKVWKITIDSISGKKSEQKSL